MFGSQRRLPRISAEASWLGKAPCGSWVITGLPAGAPGSGQKISLWGGAGAVCGQKLVRSAVKPTLLRGDSVMRVGAQSRQGDGGDDATLPGIKPFPGASGDELAEELRDEDRLVRVIRVAVVGDRNGGRISTEGEGRQGMCRVGDVDDADTPVGMVGDEEKRPVRRDRTAPRFGADGDLREHPDRRTGQ